MKHIIITGGTGFIGKNLIEKLNQKGYTINVLSREKEFVDFAQTFWWNPSKNFIDERALEGVTDIIHLSGSNILEKPWNKRNKDRLINSRIRSIELLFNTVKKYKIKLDSFSSASAIGYYGAVTQNQIFDENTTPQHQDFASVLCQKWEEKADLFSEITRVNKVRIGLALGKDGGILSRLSSQHILSPLGSGKQWFPWVSVDDVSNIFIHLLENNHAQGVFNATAPNPITNAEFTSIFAKKSGKINLPITPAFALKMILGDRSELLLNGTRISSDKIIQTGFKFQDTDLNQTLDKYLHSVV
ncbi:MAG: TIGR01777 family oxidoreductase [Flavobacteriales bacterium]